MLGLNSFSLLLLWLLIEHGQGINLLIGIEIQGEYFSSKNTSNLLEYIRTRVRPEEYDAVTYFACLHADNTFFNPSVYTMLEQEEIKFFFSAGNFPVLCAFEYPRILDYDQIVQVNSNFNGDLPYFSSSSSSFIDDHLQFFNLNISGLSFVIDSLKLEYISQYRVNEYNEQLRDRFFLASLLKSLFHAETKIITNSTENNCTSASQLSSSKDNPGANIFSVKKPKVGGRISPLNHTRSSSVIYHSSGPCNLWWPLNFSEVFLIDSAPDRFQDNRLFPHNNNGRVAHDQLVILVCPQIGRRLNKKRSVPTKQHIHVDFFEDVGAWDLSPDIEPQFSGTFPVELNSMREPSNFPLQIQVKKTSAFVRLRISVCFEEIAAGCVSVFNIINKVVRWSDTPPISSEPLTRVQLHPMLATLDNRDSFGHVLNNIGYGGVGRTFVEVGVQRGHFSQLILSQWMGNRYIMVDPWSEVEKDKYIDLANVENEQQLVIMGEALQRVQAFVDRPAVLPLTSTAAANLLVDETVDIVYLDALHHYHGVMDDIYAWWKKIKSGGILAGHDYLLIVGMSTV